ncbi:MAG: hypothetical protein KBG15_03655 [Kofleriaceae bacterium]|nr:hypothetical protein [Kofleriaceae bacterium]
MQSISDFFAELDHAWGDEAVPVILPLFGAGALVLQTAYYRATKDSDIFETLQHTASIKSRLQQLAGRDAVLHRRHRMYLEFVPNGIPFFPREPLWHPVPLRLRWLRIQALDITDVEVSKLARFHADDRQDIDEMVQRGLVSHTRLYERFVDAVHERSMDARADQLPAYVDRFHTVERDMFGTEESEIELPSWI